MKRRKGCGGRGACREGIGVHGRSYLVLGGGQSRGGAERVSCLQLAGAYGLKGLIYGEGRRCSSRNGVILVRNKGAGEVNEPNSRC